ncbi:MAG: hypothetical protein ACLSGL_14715 [Blautia wexlerae]
MPRTIVYKAGGFTNCGIGYTKFSQEELAEMKDRVMTENEAIKILRKDSCYECAQGTDSPVNCEYRECRVAEATRAAIKALEEIQQYRAIGTPEECRAAVEKQTAKKVKSISQVKDGDSYVGLIGRCPCCGDILEEDTVYCDCGQRLDWGTSDEID